MISRYEGEISLELWQQIQSLMNALRLGCHENEIQRQLGMVWHLYSKEFLIDDELYTYGK